MTIKFDLSVPFLPFEQLLAVLPANSKSLLPEAYQVSIASDKPQYFDCVKITVYWEIFAALSFREIKIRKKYFRKSYTCAI